MLALRFLVTKSILKVILYSEFNFNRYFKATQRMKPFILVHKNHLLPVIKQPIRSSQSFLIEVGEAGNQIDALKILKQMPQQQKKKIKKKKEKLNLQIAQQFNKYNPKYLSPMKECPDYYQMLFQHVLKKYPNECMPKKSYTRSSATENNKSSLFAKNEHSVNSNSSEDQISQMILTSKSQEPQIEQKSQIKLKSKFEEKSTDNSSSKIVGLIHNVSATDKFVVYKKYQKLYRFFCSQNITFSTLLIEGEIFHLEPILMQSPLDYFLVRGPNRKSQGCFAKTMVEAKSIFNSSTELREKSIFEFKKHITDIKNKYEFISKKSNIPFHRLMEAYGEQSSKTAFSGESPSGNGMKQELKRLLDIY